MNRISVAPNSRTKIKVILLKVMTIISVASIVAAVALYLNSSALLNNGAVFDSIFSGLFMFSIVFFGLHSIGYFLNAIRSIERYPSLIGNYLNEHFDNYVAVLVPVYNEPFEMFRMNLGAVVNATKGYGTVYVLDDSTNLEISTNIENLCRDLKIQYIHREDRSGYKAGAINAVLKSNTLKEEFICVFDADQLPDPNFLKEVLPYLIRDPKLALVQVPQNYTNTDASLLSLASQAQQSIFYDVITEGKCSLGTLFSCGTNIVYRKEALQSVDGFDESSITEDLATTVNMHIKGWKTFYFNKKLVYGRAPTELTAYFNQQSRWAFGTLRLLKKISSTMLRGKFSLSYKFDYFLSCNWYLVGWAYLIQMLAPILFLLFGTKPLLIDETTYVAVILPYSLFTMTTFLIGFKKSGIPLRYIYYNLSMNIISFPITIGASIQALMNKRKSFVTARTGSRVPWYKLWPQLLIIFLLAASVVSGILFHMDSWFYIVNIFSAAFHLAVMIPIFWLNSIPKESSLDMQYIQSKK